MLQWPSQHAGGLPEKADIKLCSPAFHAAASTVQSCSYYRSNPVLSQHPSLHCPIQFHSDLFSETRARAAYAQ